MSRPRDTVMQDPNASAEEIEEIAQMWPSLALQHPNISPAFWKKLAKYSPVEAYKSPLFPILLLEEPNFWNKLEQDHAQGWISRCAQELTDDNKQLFLADCFEYVQTLMASDWSALTGIIEARRTYVKNQLPEQEWHRQRAHAAWLASMLLAFTSTESVGIVVGRLLTGIRDNSSFREGRKLEQETTLWIWRKLLEYALAQSKE